MRHPPVGVPPGICYGCSDVALRPGWQEAMPALAQCVARSRPVLLLSSPATRCLLPARALAELLDVPLRIEPELGELDFGAWEGLSWDRVPRHALDRWAADPLGFAPPGGESGRALLARVTRVACALRQDARDTAVMTHGGPLRVLPALLRGETANLLSPAPAMGSLQTVSLPG